jgi:DNA segregation ATPase FtsK/SpoIIIE, S-DNA-T family
MATERSTLRPAPLQGGLLLLLSILLGLAFATHQGTLPACGPLADWVADGAIGLFGPIAAWGLWALLPPIAILWFLGRGMRGLWLTALCLAPLVIVLSLAFAPVSSLSGKLGMGGLAFLGGVLGPWGKWIVLTMLGMVSVWLVGRFLLPDIVIETVSGWLQPPERRAKKAREKSARSSGEGAKPKLRLVEREKKAESARYGLADEEEAEDDPLSAQDERKRAAVAEPKIRTRPMRASGSSGPVRKPTTETWMLPEISLLTDLDGTDGTIDKQEMLETSHLLVKTLKDFGVSGRVGEIHPGPVITRYEFEPAAGVRVNQIVSRVDDLALALRASRIRLVAPIPGKAAVGIEVPNSRPAMISLKEILASEEFRRQDGPLTMALGRDIAGHPVFARLDTMPHLLVAGTTGSGKSVGLNALLLSILFRHTPDDVRLILIDPKRLELTPYDGIPALVRPVVTEPKQATKILEWLCGEMDRRYRLLQQAGAKNIESYRRRVAESEKQQELNEELPYIVVVVDELADLMLTQGVEIEGPISRLAHMARAVGIHMILATQRPSVDVLTGVIKANFPARIAFQVASRIDSRTILDAGGAEFLLGKGDMLFVPPGKAEAIRVHGAFSKDVDADRVAAFLREQPPAPPLMATEQEGEDGSDPTCEDELFLDAMRLVVREHQASVSFLQRRLKVGYSRAARLMDLLEAAGVVSPYDGSKAREVMVDESFLEGWDEGSQGPNAGRRS